MGAANGGDPVLVQPGQDQGQRQGHARQELRPPLALPHAGRHRPESGSRQNQNGALLHQQRCRQAKCRKHGGKPMPAMGRGPLPAPELPEGQCGDCGEGKIQGEIHPQGDQSRGNGGQNQRQDS
ncbi:MAG: hypothetical protein OXC96_11025 [Cyanobacteria bacterium MAG CAR1_bin_15]|nr:hypothetical protein [Cyanobacteria bacterium MAG CAR1_bin_15]